MKTVGVVIPIYNVEKYLKECLESVINQTYKNLQVVLINDGSTDENSLNIAKEYTLKDERFILFDKENGGQSTARNVGIEFFSKEYHFKNITPELKENSLVELKLSNKDNPYNIYKIYKSSNFFKNKDELLNFKAPDIDYIIFLDSDDYWELNCIEECVPRMNGVEVVWFSFKIHSVVEGIDSIDSSYDDFKEETKSGVDWMTLLYNGWFLFYNWTAMIDFKHLTTLSYKLRYVNKTIYEDHVFGICLFLSCNAVLRIPHRLYTYRVRYNSTCDFGDKKSVALIAPFMKNMYDEFNNEIEKTRSYHLCSSHILTYLELLTFIEKNKIANKYPNSAILKRILDNLGYVWGILDYEKDPLDVLNKIPKQLYIEKVFSFKKEVESLKKHGGAKAIIQNHLSYKLGQTLIINSKSVLGYLSLPFIIFSIVIAHKQERKAYKLKIKKNSLPPLESYPDYHEALKEKECFTYKLGQAFIKASKNWYGGGGIEIYLQRCA